MWNCYLYCNLMTHKNNITFIWVPNFVTLTLSVLTSAEQHKTGRKLIAEIDNSTESGESIDIL